MAIRRQVNLINYQGQIKTFDIVLSQRSDSNLTIIYTKQSGDEVVYIYEYGALTYKLDADDGSRSSDLLDELQLISLEELVELHR